MMPVYFLDAGTTWSKILKVENGKKEYSVIKTSDLKNLNLDFEIITGHSINKIKGKYENEVVALSYGVNRNELQNETVLDLGSRDAKRIKFKNSKFQDMDWNTNCASATGATIEMLLKFYNLDIKELKPTKEKYPVTCGIFGLEKIMDDISNGVDTSYAVSKFISGIAFNAYNFTKCPNKIYLSGGFCENHCFVESLKFYTEVILLGRFVLVDGLYNIYKNNMNNC